MAFLPFTLIFFVCLLHFHQNMAKPYIGRALDTWPQNCSKRNYCTDKPRDYPSESLSKELYFNLILNVDIPTPDDIETGHRFGSSGLCRIHENSDPVYMIIDEHNEARYTIQIPGVHEFNVTLRTCHEDDMLEGLGDKIECQQTYTPLTFLVLSHDWTKMEIARVREGLPTNCAPIFMDNNI